MFYRLALTTGLILTSLVSINPVAQAEVSFSNLVPGGLEPARENLRVLESVTPSTLTVSVLSDSTANITILPPSLVSGSSDDPNGTTRVGLVSFGSTNLTSDGGNNTASLPPGDTNLEVRLRVERPVVFTAGSYQYAVNLNVTITPP